MLSSQDSAAPTDVLVTMTTPSGYGWIITEDLFAAADEPSVVGKAGGKRHAEMAALAVPGTELGTVAERFEMYDDDHNLCFRGIRLTVGSGFEPLNDFGMGHSGCTYIKTPHPHTGTMSIL